MYDRDMTDTESRLSHEQEPQINLDALWAAMERRGWVAADLAAASGVHKSTLSLILRGERPNSPAIIVARLALALGVSVDYLLGLTNDPSPKSVDLSQVMADLMNVAQTLPECRQQDLLLIAQAYQRSIEEGALDADQLMANVLEQVEAEGGSEALDVLLRVLERLLPGRQLGPSSRRSAEEAD